VNRLGIHHSLILGVCIAIAGMSIGLGFYKGRAVDRYVTVKGLAEREVNADLAIWPITFKVAEDDLIAVQRGVDSGRDAIKSFLVAAGFAEDEISFSAPTITDTEAQPYASGNESKYRYIAEATVTARSANVGRVRRTMEDSRELIGKGVVLAAKSWENPTEFLFTGLDAIKPEMIEEATKDARRAAEKFAQDSGSRVGKIRNATQGYFSISDRDRNSPEVKTVRVVTTVQYYLVD
jgi:hypothetical protein